MTLRETVLPPNAFNCLPAPFGAYKFPEATSLSTCFSSDRSATRRFRRTFLLVAPQLIGRIEFMVDIDDTLMQRLHLYRHRKPLMTVQPQPDKPKSGRERDLSKVLIPLE